MQTTSDQALERISKLEEALEARAASIEKYERYFEGQQDLRFATRKFREAFGSLFREFSNNYCGLVVDVAVERMNVEGFRVPTEKSKKEEQEALESARAKQNEVHRAMALAAARQASQNQRPGTGTAPTTPPATQADATPEQPLQTPAELKAAEDRIGSEYDEETGGTIEGTGDPEAWEMWQRNNMDQYADIAHETAFVCGVSYLIVGPQDDGSTDNPVITVEHPLEVIVSTFPGSSRRSAALKKWYDDETGLWMVTLYCEDSIWKLQSSVPATDVNNKDGITWVGREDTDVVIPNPLGVVPVIPLTNKQKLHGPGISELKDVIPLQDVINKTYNDALVASEFAAFRQRILTGMEVPEDENGNIIPDFDLKASISRLLLIKDKDVGVHEFQISELQQYVTLMEHTRGEIASKTRTPPQYFADTISNVKGDALKGAESGLVSKVKRRSKNFGEGYEEAIRLGFLLKGDKEKANSYDAETIWKNPEITTESSLMDSLAKLATLGVPTQALWEKAGASQTEIARWQKMLADNPMALPPQALAAMIQGGAKAGI